MKDHVNAAMKATGVTKRDLLADGLTGAMNM
jgi:hypothetical protein